MNSERGRYIIIDMENLAILETNILSEIQDCHPEYANQDELIKDAKQYLDMYSRDSWSAYIQYLKEWASSHEDCKYAGMTPDDYYYFWEQAISKKEGEKQ